ncbi:MAG: ribosome hibernation-promoting factor, HPF/YfiA family [Actinomycetota bacterium]
MEITVRGKHHPVPATLQEFAVHKLEHLGRYLTTITTIDCELFQDGKPKDGRGMVAYVKVATHGPVFRARAVTGDHRASVDIAYERLERQIKEFKRRRSGKPQHSRPKASATDI